jgi:hypothetical protein
MSPVARIRALSLALDAFLVGLAAGTAAVVALGALYVLAPEAPLRPAGWAGLALFVLLFLSRDATGGLSRKWLGFQMEDEESRIPGWGRSVLRNLPLVVPGWNLYCAYRVWRRPEAPLVLDRVLGLRRRPIP